MESISEPPHFMLLQPFGAALIDSETGRVDFLNKMTLITKVKVAGKSVDEIGS
jgi:hypothetical protein